MYQDLKTLYWWPGIKKNVAEFVARCLTCQQVKEEHQSPLWLLQPLYVSKLKWEDIAMNFMVGLPKTTKQQDSGWVIVDRLTKSTHFLPVKTTYSLDLYTKLYVKSWSRYLPLTEFSYNNSYQSTIGKAPCDMLYGRKCRSPLHWDEVGEKQILGPEAVREASEVIEKIRQRCILLKVSKSATQTLREGTSSFQFTSLCS
ncbi:uncharacterized protein LOC133823924 [Humulus lupulus]|uniref:uncharacterized protein LOC133823924 n=1 Tax=Humulus lupulus TaxID=3486 RepID=UPI002B410EAF|nr:uncharacterized protein LOC133823924 [Humulus lupulus]